MNARAAKIAMAQKIVFNLSTVVILLSYVSDYLACSAVAVPASTSSLPSSYLSPSSFSLLSLPNQNRISKQQSNAKANAKAKKTPSAL